MANEGKFHELIDELKQLVQSRPYIGDTLLPPLFLLLFFAIWDLRTAVLITGAGLLLLLLYRGVRRRPLRPALGGLVTLLIAAGLVALLNDDTGFFLPGIISSGLILLTALGSLLWKRPMVAWTSFVARRWPWNWYWHPQVRPAYSEVTWIWAGYFLIRLLIQLFFFNQSAVGALTTLNFILGWPSTLLLLIVSYLYGTHRLRQLGGPSVAEFRENEPPPWTSQQRGF